MLNVDLGDNAGRMYLLLDCFVHCYFCGGHGHDVSKGLKITACKKFAKSGHLKIAEIVWILNFESSSSTPLTFTS